MPEAIQSSGLERVEYQLSPGYVKSWGGKELLRELFANALDTGADYHIEFVPTPEYGRNMGIATVEDQAEGFPRAFLMMGGGEEKTNDQIGQFKEGLKIAMLVAARKKRMFSLETTGFAVDSVALESGQLGSGLAIYLDNSKIRSRGTRVRVQVTQGEFNKAVQLFGGIKAEGHTIRVAPIADPSQAAVWKDKGKMQKVFINGLEVQSTHCMFSYNLVGDGVKLHQNRDRTVVNWWEIKSKAVALLMATADEALIRKVFEFIFSKDDKSHGDIMELHRVDQAVESVWKRVALDVLSTHDLRNTRAETLRVCVESSYQPENNLIAREQGFTVLSNDKCGRFLSALFPVAAQAIEKAAKAKVKKIEKVANRSLTVAEREKITEVRARLQPFFEQELPPFRVFSRSYMDRDAVGYWMERKVWIRRDQLGTSGPAGVRNLLEISLHELCHWRSGAYDRTRSFEKALGFLAADLILSVKEINSVKPLAMTEVEHDWVLTLNGMLVSDRYQTLTMLGVRASLPIVPQKGDLAVTKQAEKLIKRCEGRGWIPVTVVPNEGGDLGYPDRVGHHFWSMTEKGKNVVLRFHQSRAEQGTSEYRVQAWYCYYEPNCSWSNMYEPLPPVSEEAVG